MIESQVVSSQGKVLKEQQVLETLRQGVGRRFAGQKLLVLVPDHTRSLPLPFLFRALVELLADCRQLDFMIALGTHPPLIEDDLNRLLGITSAERSTRFQAVGLMNHCWDEAGSLTS